MQLVIEKRGTSLKVKDGQLIVKYGDQQQALSFNQIESMVLSKASVLTGEVIAQAIEHQIDLLFVERGGKPFARLWSPYFGSISTIRRHQLLFSQSAEALDWVKEMLSRKMENQQALLYALALPNGTTDKLIAKTVEHMNEDKERLAKIKGASLYELAPRIRAIEGQATRRYFQCVNLHLPEMYRFSQRSRRPALDMTNAMLNYAYGMLYGRMESALIKAGLDPMIGIMHREEYNRPVLTYDCIEMFRTWADWVVFDLCRQQVIFKEFFEIEAGGYWLANPGKRILIQHLTDFFEEQIEWDGAWRSRFTHMQLFAQRLASKMKAFQKEKQTNDQSSKT